MHARQGALINGVAEQFTIQVNLDDAGQMGFAHLAVKARSRSPVREFAPTPLLARVLGALLSRPLRLLFQCLNTAVPFGAGIKRDLRIMRNDELLTPTEN